MSLSSNKYNMNHDYSYIYHSESFKKKKKWEWFLNYLHFIKIHQKYLNLFIITFVIRLFEMVKQIFYLIVFLFCCDISSLSYK